MIISFSTISLSFYHSPYKYTLHLVYPGRAAAGTDPLPAGPELLVHHPGPVCTVHSGAPAPDIRFYRLIFNSYIGFKDTVHEVDPP